MSDHSTVMLILAVYLALLVANAWVRKAMDQPTSLWIVRTLLDLLAYAATGVALLVLRDRPAVVLVLLVVAAAAVMFPVNATAARLAGRRRT